MTAIQYSTQASQWAKALKLLDPSLVLILCGETGHSTWDHTVLQSCIPFIDMHSIHIYTCSNSHLPNVTAPLSAEHAITTAASLISIARITSNIPASKPPTMICFDEWNVWDPIRAPGELGAEQSYTLSDALAVAVWLNVFVRQSKYVGMANIAQSVNVISPLMTTEKGIVKQTSWWPLLLFSKYMRGWTIGVHVSGGAWTEGETSPSWLRGVVGTEGVSWLDVSASVDTDGTVNCVVVNISEQKDFATVLDLHPEPRDSKDAGEEKDRVTAFTVTGSSIKSTNTEEREEVGMKESTWDGKGEYTFPRHSMTLLRWGTGRRVVDVSGKEEEATEGLNVRKLVVDEKLVEFVDEQKV